MYLSRKMYIHEVTIRQGGDMDTDEDTNTDTVSYKQKEKCLIGSLFVTCPTPKCLGKTSEKSVFLLDILEVTFLLVTFEQP